MTVKSAGTYAPSRELSESGAARPITSKARRYRNPRHCDGSSCSNPNETDLTKLRVFSGEESFDTTSDAVEEPGKWFAPQIASLLTSGGRSLLAMLEGCIADAGGTFLFCDTDNAAIVSTEHQRQIAMPDGAETTTALSWAEVQRIVDRFKNLNPYNRKLVPGSILKVHKLNWDCKGGHFHLE